MWVRDRWTRWSHRPTHILSVHPAAADFELEEKASCVGTPACLRHGP